ncbi:MAG TPA: DMT family transporter [Candidatus Binatia bacterium]|nr:DMT family transporter [Candidatus Binatia bacterium]
MKDDLRAGAGFAVLAAAAFAATAACVKAASAAAPNEVVVFFRSAVSLLVLAPWMLRHGLDAVRTTRPVGHLVRAGFGVCAMYSFFYAIAHLHLSEAMLLTYSTPLYLPFLAWAWLKEPPPPVVLLAVGLGLVGIVLIARPGAGGLLDTAGLVGAISGLCAACAMVTIRSISATEPAPRIVFHFAALSTAISAVPLLWAWRTPSPHTLALLVATGLLATLGQLSLTRAYALAPAARIGAFAYSSVIFAGVLGWLLWGERPDARSLAGMALVIGCCLLAGWRPRA